MNAVKELAEENDRLKVESASLKARADKADARASKAEADAAQLKAALCSKFPDLTICSFVGSVGMVTSSHNRP